MEGRALPRRPSRSCGFHAVCEARKRPQQDMAASRLVHKLPKVTPCMAWRLVPRWKRYILGSHRKCVYICWQLAGVQIRLPYTATIDHCLAANTVMLGLASPRAASTRDLSFRLIWSDPSKRHPSEPRGWGDIVTETVFSKSRTSSAQVFCTASVLSRQAVSSWIHTSKAATQGQSIHSCHISTRAIAS